MNAQETRQRRIDEVSDAAAARHRQDRDDGLGLIDGHGHRDQNGADAETLARQEMILGHPLSARILTTQVSSVRDEPTPTLPSTPTPTSTSRAQSPIANANPGPSISKEGTLADVSQLEAAAVPPPGQTSGDVGTGIEKEKATEKETEKEKEEALQREQKQEEARKTLYDELFKTMLTKVDSQPSSTPTLQSGSDKDDSHRRDTKLIPKREREREREREEKEINYKTSDFVKQGLIPMSLAWRAFEQGSKNERASEGNVGTAGRGEESEVEFNLGNL